MNIIYQEIDSTVEEAIIKQYGSWVRDYGCLSKGEGCYRVAAMDTDNGAVAGFTALHPAQWIAPLEQYFDGFIEVIEVAEKYRRQGIGETLVGILEKYAAAYGYYQIRALLPFQPLYESYNNLLQKEKNKEIKTCREMKLKAKGNYAKIRPSRRTDIILGQGGKVHGTLYQSGKRGVQNIDK